MITTAPAVFFFDRKTASQTSRHSATRVKEHFSTDKNSHVYKHLNGSPSCKQKCPVDCFKILDSAKTKRCLKLKEAIYISRLKQELNAQLQHNRIEAWNKTSSDFELETAIFLIRVAKRRF